MLEINPAYFEQGTLHRSSLIGNKSIVNLNICDIYVSLVTGRFITRSVHYWKNGRFITINSFIKSGPFTTRHARCVI